MVFHFSSATLVKQEQPVSFPDDTGLQSLSPPPPCSVQVMTTSSTTVVSPLVSSVTVSSEGIKNEDMSMLELDNKVCVCPTSHCWSTQ